MAFYPGKTRPTSLLNDLKNIPGRACLDGVDNDAFCERGKLAYEKTLPMKLLCKNLTHV